MRRDESVRSFSDNKRTFRPRIFLLALPCSVRRDATSSAKVRARGYLLPALHIEANLTFSHFEIYIYF